MKFLPLCALLVVASFAATEGEIHVHIYTAPIEPFSYNNGREGFAIDFLNHVLDGGLKLDPNDETAAEHVTSTITEVANNQEIFDAVNNATNNETEFAIGTAAISITAERALFIDFLFPFYQSGFQVMAREKSDFNDVAREVTRKVFLSFGLFALGFFVIIYSLTPLVFFFEYKFSGEEIPIFLDRENYEAMKKEPKWKRMLMDIWVVWQWVTFTVVGTQTGYPNALGARVIHTSLKILRTLILVVATGAMASVFTVSSQANSIKGFNDLGGHTVCVDNRETTPTKFMEAHLGGAFLVYFESTETMFNGFRDGLCDAVVYDFPVLKQQIVTWGEEGANVNAVLVGEVFNEEGYGIVVQKGNPYKEFLNHKVIETVTDYDQMKLWYDKYIEDIRGVTGEDSLSIPDALIWVPSILGFCLMVLAVVYMWRSYEEKDELYQANLDARSDMDYADDLQDLLRMENRNVSMITKGVDYMMDKVVVPLVMRIARVTYEAALIREGKDVVAIERGLVPRTQTSIRVKYLRPEEEGDEDGDAAGGETGGQEKQLPEKRLSNVSEEKEVEVEEDGANTDEVEMTMGKIE